MRRNTAESDFRKGSFDLLKISIKHDLDFMMECLSFYLSAFVFFCADDIIAKCLPPQSVSFW